MKKIILLCIILAPFYLSAQRVDKLTRENEMLRARIDSLESKIDDKYYTRIPNKDFDVKLVDTISERVNNYVRGKIELAGSIIAVLSFLLGFLAKYYFSESTRNQIEDNVKKISERVAKENEDAQNKLNNLLKDQKEFINDNNRLNDNRISELNSRFDNLRLTLQNQLQQLNVDVNRNIDNFQTNADSRLKQVEEQLTKVAENTQSMAKSTQSAQESFEKVSSDRIDNKISETFDFLWADIISGMMVRAKEQGYKGLLLINEFEKILQKNPKITVELKVKVIDTLMRCFYNTEILENEVDVRYDKMVALIRKYEDTYNLLPETYANAAIGLINNYELFGTPDLFEAALSNCDKSIQRDRNYGLPYALKMELYAIASTKTRENELKSKYKYESENLLYLIDRTPSPLLKGEFLDRLSIDKQVDYIRVYIEQLYVDYAKELTPFRENVVEQLVKNYSRAGNYEKDIYKNLLGEGLEMHPNLDGAWNAITYTEAGTPIDLTNNKGLLTLKEDTYSIAVSNENSNGVIYFLPSLVPYAFQLIITEPKDKAETIKGIYKFDEVADELTLCLAPPQKERPDDFVSTAENHYSLLTFVRE